MSKTRALRYVIFSAGTIFTVMLALISFSAANGGKKEEAADTGIFVYDNFSDYIIHDSLIYELGKDDYRVYSLKNKKPVWETVQYLNRPEQVILNGVLHIYENEGSRILKVGRKRIEGEYEVENGSIYRLIEINRNLIGIIHKIDRYKTSLRIVDKTFAGIFERAYSDSFVVDALMTAKNRVAILLASSYGESIKAYIEVVDINSGKVLDEIIMGQEVFTGMHALGRGRTAVISGTQIRIFDDMDEESGQIRMDSHEAIYDIFIDGSGLVLLIGERPAGFDSVSMALRIERYTGDGKKLDSFPAEPEMTGICLVKGKIVGIYPSGIIVYDKNGEFLSKSGSDGIIEKIIGYRDAFYFFYNNRIEKVIP